MTSSSIRVAAVVVSYNRETLLQECLDSLEQQTYPLYRTIVIDNASTDNAVHVAKQHPLRPQVTRLNENVGGAGGFAAGIAIAASDPNVDYVWIMDDDTIPTLTALEKLVDALREATQTNGEEPVIMGSKAIWTDGREHLMNKPRPRRWIYRGAATLTQSKNAYQARSFSFVSCLVNATAIRARRALPIGAYFLWNDDFEFTTRLLKEATGYYVPQSIVEHKTKVFGSSNADPGARFRFEVRNKRWLFKYAQANFSGKEKLYYHLATLKRWVETMLRSHDKKTLLGYAKQGWKEAGAGKPKSNAAVLAKTPEVASIVEQFES
ncbi:glycosyltransferase [Alloscardovia criceti]|uniref:glycosyltransferase n=1 Tax=Alloscardovia criceti TaxID=356828 RepID=UPI000370F80F|nr:glycosyltransferase [Alloscardovia criceti]